MDTRIYQIGKKAVHGCLGCGRCQHSGNCIFNDNPANEMRTLMQDAEGLQTMRTLGYNMAWMLKNIAEGGQPLPEIEPWNPTHFIR